MTIENLIFEALGKSYSEKLKALPPPPPDHYYAPGEYEIRRDGENYVIDVELTLKPVPVIVPPSAMKYPGIDNYTLVALNEAKYLEPFKGILEKGASAIPPSPKDPYIDPLTDTERTLLNTSLELAEQVGQVYDHALRIISLAASELCDAVERYVCPKRGDKTCLRSELLNTKERLREALKP